MQKIILIIACFATFSAFGQTDWTLSNTGLPTNYIPIDFAIAPNGDVYYICRRNSLIKLFRSTDNGASWSQITMTGVSDLDEVSALIFTGEKLLLGGNTVGMFTEFFILESTDYGSNWTATTGLWTGYQPRDFAVAPNGDLYVVAADREATPFTPALFRSINNGSSWTHVPMSGLPNALLINSITFHGSNLLIACGYGDGNSLFVSTNNGFSWTLSDTGIPTDCSVRELTTTSDQIIYGACTRNYAFDESPLIIRSTNGGASWSELSVTGLDDIEETNTIIYSNNSLLLGGSNSSTSLYYVFNSALPPASIEDEVSTSSYTIYPNPFDDKLFVSSPFGSSAQVRLTNTSGQILFEKKITGNDPIDTSSLPVGLYFVDVYDHSNNKTIKLLKK